jgi:hypothetical protein
MVVLGLV